MQCATKNARFSQLIHALQFQTDRQLVLLYMLMQLVLSSPEYKVVEHASAAWPPFWGESLSSDIGLRDWIWVDALLRSRTFDLSYSGVSMIPCLDLANHSISYTAYWRQDVNNEAVTLFLLKGSSVPAGEVFTIIYGRTSQLPKCSLTTDLLTPARW
ncbi:hypothetical protein BR93DRAFT_584825 [Coniochaeta sp. PMI_546]|nr:hypothetical protein BR93DRAFT_584825 [Coniochaeta sp. PMI_546]